jgi:TniQ
MLARHPFPAVNESFYGYLLRVSQQNGFESIWSVFLRAGLKQHESRGTGIKTSKFAMITGCPTALLDDIAYSTSLSTSACRILGHPIHVRFLDISHPRICPQCILDQGFIEAQWDLVSMIGCPVHSCWALVTCPSCSSEISWYRPELLRCKCAAMFRNGQDEPLPSSLRSLLELIRTKVLRLLPLVDCKAGLPIFELSRLDLNTLLSVISILGSCSVRSNGDLSCVDDQVAIMTSAATVLAAWPTNLFDLLQNLGGRLHKNPHDIRAQFAPLYSSLFRRIMPANPDYLDFLRIAFLDFVSNHWTPRRIDGRTLKRVAGLVEKQFLSSAEIARSLQVDPRTFKRHILLHDLAVVEGPNSTFIREPSWQKVMEGASRNVLRARAAAKEIGLSVTVLCGLKEAGIFEVEHLLLGLPGFDREDVMRFKKRLLALIPGESRTPSTNKNITLGQVLRTSRYSVREKVKVIRELLNNRISVIGSTDGSFRGLQISQSQLSSMNIFQRDSDGESVVTGGEAATALNCDFEAVRTLIRLGYLEGAKTSRSWQITERSVREFDKAFVRLSSVADIMRSSSRRLMAVCKSNMVDVVEIRVRGSGVQPFVRRESLNLVVAFARSTSPY